MPDPCSSIRKTPRLRPVSSASHITPVPGRRSHAGWDASISLTFEKPGNATILSDRAHSGPLRVQKALYPEGPGVCHVILLHPPGGIVAGDHLHIDLALRPHSHALVTTPGASKWYRSLGPRSLQESRIHVCAGAVVEWLPQEAIVFDQANVEINHSVSLEPAAVYVGWDTFCLGRRASGERFEQGMLGLRTRIERAGHPLWLERALLQGGSRLLHSPAGFDKYSVQATFVAVSDKLDTGLLAQCRSIQADEEAHLHGLTLLPDLLLGRYLGHSAQAARLWMTRLWQVLRPPLTGCQAAIPRIWNT